MTQLSLFPEPADEQWKLSDETKRVGRWGVQVARDILKKARRIR